MIKKSDFVDLFEQINNSSFKPVKIFMHPDDYWNLVGRPLHILYYCLLKRGYLVDRQRDTKEGIIMRLTHPEYQDETIILRYKDI